MYFMHTITQQKRTSFASMTAFRSVEAPYLYSPDTLWMLTWGKRVEQSSKNTSTGLVRPLTNNHDLGCLFVYWMVVFDLNVFICLHRGAPCISFEVKETNDLTQSHMHAQWFCFWFYLIKPVIREISALRGKIATECLWGVFQTFVAYLSIS